MTTDLHDQLLALIETSIVNRYDGDLEKHEDLYMGGSDTYTPLDTDAIRELLTALWGEHITAKTIETVFKNLVENGAEKWPQAWCEEDIEQERQDRIDGLGNEIDHIEDHLDRLKAEYAKLTGR